MNKPYTRYFEMAIEKRALSIRIMSQCPDIHMQILKLYMFPNSPNVPHWSQKLRGYLRFIHLKLKSTGKFPDFNFYNKYLGSTFNDTSYYETLKYAIEDKYLKLMTREDSKEFPDEINFEALMKDFIIKISMVLAKSENANLSELINEFIDHVRSA